MFKNQPAGLYILSLANTGERFGYFTVISVFIFFLQAKFGFDTALIGQIYAIFMAVVYFMPIFGGIVADRWSFSKCVATGMLIMAAGYLVVALPSPLFSQRALWLLIAGLLLICVGTGLFKSNLQVMIGDLYNNPRYSAQRDAGFSIFYMAINLGAMFAPAMATYMVNTSLGSHGFVYTSGLAALCTDFLGGQTALAPEIMQTASAAGMTATDAGTFATQYLTALSDGYGYSFGIAFISIALSYLIYLFGRRTYRSVATAKADTGTAAAAAAPELTAAQTRSRITALLMVFAVVIFFWMVFMQNGATLNKFAESCTSAAAGGFTRIGFNVWALLTAAVAIYSLFSIFQSRRTIARIASAALLLASGGLLAWFYTVTPDPLTTVQPQDYQQFNGFYIIALTPVSLAFFGWLARKGKEPSAPRKIGYGMIVAAIAYMVMVASSAGISGTTATVSSNWLISTYLLLTISELLLSPMGISFVSKVAPPKYKGIMMGCWFGATAIGNYLVSIPMALWGKIPVWLIWVILAGLCLISAGFIFAIMKKLEAATADPAPAAIPDAEPEME